MSQSQERLVSPEDFRRLALALQGVIEASHMRHPDFRVSVRCGSSGRPEPYVKLAGF